MEALGDQLLALRRAASERTVLLLASFRPGLRLDFGASGITRPPAGSHWAPALSTDAERFGGDGTLDLTEDGVRLEEPGAVVLWARGS